MSLRYREIVDKLSIEDIDFLIDTWGSLNLYLLEEEMLSFIAIAKSIRGEKAKTDVETFLKSLTPDQKAFIRNHYSPDCDILGVSEVLRIDPLVIGRICKEED